MYCAKCGTRLPEDAIVCYKCATATAGYAVPQKNRLKSPLVIVAIVIGALILVPVLIAVIAVGGLSLGVGSVGWQASVRAGNETNTAQSLDNIRKFQAQYASRNKGNFAEFDELILKVGLDEKFRGEQPIVNGYVFVLTVAPASASTPSSYSVTADPQVSDGISATGTRHFYTDSSLNSIRATDENRPAQADDPAI